MWAVGNFYLDTTSYENGVHTIAWTAVDDAGNTDCIGSQGPGLSVSTGSFLLKKATGANASSPLSAKTFYFLKIFLIGFNHYVML